MFFFSVTVQVGGTSAARQEIDSIQSMSMVSTHEQVLQEMNQGQLEEISIGRGIQHGSRAQCTEQQAVAGRSRGMAQRSRGWRGFTFGYGEDTMNM